MARNDVLIFHTKDFCYVNSKVKPYSVQHLSSSEPLTNMVQCLVVICHLGV